MPPDPPCAFCDVDGDCTEDDCDHAYECEGGLSHDTRLSAFHCLQHCDDRLCITPGRL